MFNKIILIGLLILVASILQIGCSKAPSELATTAQKALDEAKESQADIYFPAEFSATNDSIKIALAEIENQKSKSIFSRNYYRSEQLLQEAVRDANSLLVKTSLRKEEIKMQAKQLIVDINNELEGIKSQIEFLSKRKQNREFLETITSQINEVQSNIPVLSQLLDNGDYMTALKKATTYYETINLVNIQINQNLARSNAKKAKIVG